MTRLAFAFVAGLLSPLNPCGFALLPAYLAYYLGAGQESRRPLLERLSHGLGVGGALSAGFASVFVVGGLLISLGLRSLITLVPIGAVVIGVILAALGVVMLSGRRVAFRPKRQLSPGSGSGYRHIVVFGAGYAFASLACTIAVLLAVITVALGAHNPAQLVGVFVAYGTGAATLLMALTLSAALAKQSLHAGSRRLLPFVERVGAVLLIASGAYLLITNLPGLNHTALASGLSARVSGLSARLTNLVDPHWQYFLPVAAALAVLVGITLWLRRCPSRRRAAQPTDRTVALGLEAASEGNLGPRQGQGCECPPIRSEASARTAEAGARSRKPDTSAEPALDAAGGPGRK